VAWEFCEIRLHTPSEIYNTRSEESIKKRWNYIKQETDKFCAAIDNVGAPGIVAVVRARVSSFHQGKGTGIIIPSMYMPWHTQNSEHFVFVGAPGIGVFQGKT
jgi:hypothetical protein